VVVDKKEPVHLRALRNIDGLCILDADELNAWEVLKARQVLLTRPALEALASRLPRG
jgi:ribosomal protein L4